MIPQLKRRELPNSAAAVRPISDQADNRNVELVWTTGAGVTRRDWWTGERYIEELSLAPGHVRLERLQNGAPLLANHDQFDLDAVIGVTERADIVGGKGTATVRFAQTEEGEKALGMVRDGVLRNVSVGYIVHRYEKTDPPAEGGLPTWLAIDWEPAEISICPIGADPGAQVEDQGAETARYVQPKSRKETDMSQRIFGGGNSPSPAIQVPEGERVAEIRTRVLGAGLDDNFGRSLEGLPFDQACRAIVDEVAKRKPGPAINAAHRGIETTDHSDQRLRCMSEILAARYGGPAPSNEARQFSSLRVVDMARELLEINGVRSTSMNRDEIISRALHSTSDFPYLLENVAAKMLAQGYQSAPPGTREAARLVLSRDFKTQSQVQFGSAPQLQKVLEGGEFKRGTIKENKETFALSTYGRIFGISRQAMVNDDLGALGELNIKFGRQAKEFESGQITAILTANAAMNDGGNLFNATAVTTVGGHANLGTGTGSALSATGLAAATKSMRLQKDLDGVTPINCVPRYLIVPAALEYTAKQLVTAITPSTVAEVNPFADGQLTVVVDARLDASSTTAWYLASNPAMLPGLIYSYLEDAQGVQIEVRPGWDIDGFEWKARLDFTAAPADWRGLWKSNGA